MSKVQTLRGFIIQRLTSAAEEIFALFERTISEYEEQLCRSKEENERQKRLLDVVYNPEAEGQQLIVSKEEVPPEHQKRILDQEDPSEPPDVKEEQEELEGGQLHGAEQTDTSMLVCNPVPVKSENHTQDNRDTEHNFNPDCQPKPTHKETSDSESEPEDSTTEPQSGLNPLKESAVGDEFYNAEETSASSSKCASSSGQKEQLQGIHPGEKPFVCSVCGNRYGTKRSLRSHVRSHVKTRPFVCSVCTKTFQKNGELMRHMRTHTGEKPFSCSLCEASFSQKSNLARHTRTHTGEKPFSCSVCGKTFSEQGTLQRHLTVHTKQKRFFCSGCDRRFTRLFSLVRHKCKRSSLS